MSGNSLGRRFVVTTFGESHGPALGVVIDGVPPGLLVDFEAMAADLARRRPGQSALTSRRSEADAPEVLSGLFEGRTLGTPLTLLFRNTDADPSAYENLRDTFRPSHADYTYEARFGVRDWRGGGRASARETVARVAAGAVARQVLAGAGISVVAWVQRVATIEAGDVDEAAVTRADIDANAVRCPDAAAAARMEAEILDARRHGDTVGGIIRCVARGAPAGLGSPVFDKLEADLAKAMLSLPAAKGFESGSGYAGARMRGSEHNDAFVPGPGGRPMTGTNRSGGIQGGISNGMPITFTVAFKPVATLFQSQATVNRANEAIELTARGRHDPCVLPRAVPMVEAMACLVLVDHWLDRLRGSGENP
ncbi:chorismate synthase [Deltaproteobacteria bacterium]|nr:chorismate synthase [Deltaproteobacteria bacterium]